jgi:hypothetical protein
MFCGRPLHILGTGGSQVSGERSDITPLLRLASLRWTGLFFDNDRLPNKNYLWKPAHLANWNDSTNRST